MEVSVAKLREMFNAAEFDKRVAAGELTVHVVKSRPAPPGANQVPGTLSEMIAYRNKQGIELASAHRYLQPNQQLGGSGRPDPKSMLDGGVLYVPWWGGTIGDR